MQIAVFNKEGKEIEKAEAPTALFEVPMNKDMLHQVLMAQEANARPTIASSKGRGEVRGGGKKPWRQKGTGRARHGSIRSPIWKGGGVAHGPKREKIYGKKVNRKMATLALAMAISAKARDNEVVLLDAISFPDGKTRDAAEMFKNLAKNKALVAMTGKTKVVLLSGVGNAELRALRNISNIEVKPAAAISAREVLNHSYLLMSKDAINVLERRIAQK